MVLALGVLVLNPAHFPFFVTVAQELAINRAAAAAVARKEAARRKGGKGSSSNGGGSQSSCRAECGDSNVSPQRQSGSRGSAVAGGGGLAGRLSTSPPLKSSRWVLPSPRLSSSVNSSSGVALGGIGSHRGGWRGADANCGDAGGGGTTDGSTQQQQQQQWRARAEDANSVARGLVPGKIGWGGGSVGCADREQQQATPNLSEGVLQSVGAEAAQHYAALWTVLEEVRDMDPFPHVVDAAKAVIAPVAEQLEALTAARRAAAARAAEEDGARGKPVRKGSAASSGGAAAGAGGAHEDPKTPPLSTPTSPLSPPLSAVAAGEVVLGSSADTRVSASSWSSSSSLSGGGRQARGVGGGGDPGAHWVASLQAVPPAACGLNEAHMLHSFYKWSCREFSEPVTPPPAPVVPDVVDLAAPAKKQHQHQQVQQQGGAADFFAGLSPGRGPAAAWGGEAAAVGMMSVGGSMGNPALPPLSSPYFAQQYEEDKQSAHETRKEQERQRQKRELQELRERQLLLQHHRHEPVDSLSYEGGHHLYVKTRNIRVHEEADVSRAEGFFLSWMPQTIL